MELKTYLEGVVEKAYRECVGDRSYLLSDLHDSDDGSALASFHPRTSFNVVRNDDYYCGIRGDNFVVILGYSEEYAGGPYPNLALVLGNHKGTFSCAEIPLNFVELMPGEVI